LNDKQAEKVTKRIDEVVSLWRVPLGLSSYRINITYDRSYSENTEEAAKISVNWEYMQANLHFFLPIMDDQDDEQLECIIVHELAHILVAPIASEDTDRKQYEFATEQVSRALLEVRNGKIPKTRSILNHR
jgi:hypothetical protein